MSFEPDYPPIIAGDIDTLVTDASGIAPTSIISGACKVTVRWKMEGVTVPAIDPTSSFNVLLNLERQGPGADQAFGPDVVGVGSVPLSGPGNMTRQYAHDFNLPDGAVPDGIYRVTALVTHTNSGGTPGPYSGFYENGILQFF